MVKCSIKNCENEEFKNGKCKICYEKNTCKGEKCEARKYKRNKCKKCLFKDEGENGNKIIVNEDGGKSKMCKNCTMFRNIDSFKNANGVSTIFCTKCRECDGKRKKKDKNNNTSKEAREGYKICSMCYKEKNKCEFISTRGQETKTCSFCREKDRSRTRNRTEYYQTDEYRKKKKEYRENKSRNNDKRLFKL